MDKNIDQNTVQAWVQELVIPTYPALAPDPNPMFFEHRNIQGAKGNIYPSPFTDQLSSEKVDRPYQAVFLENEFIQLIMLPEIGGRIFAGLDKTNGYDFFYRHTVIKPALIGLFGPWISGGVEFNWPQHHRPGTYSATDYTIENHPDGSKTVWMSEHDPLNRTKGMVGVCLYPGKAIVETKVRLFNRTPTPQTFLWWENTGVHINEQYQVVFPPDVHYAVFHSKAPVTPYPVASGSFHSNDYGEGKDVSWYVNSPNPTSFFAGESKYNFFGGYDHSRDAGVVHVADRHISPGKKFFTWGSGASGKSWQKNLMDDEGEYLELMAGVFTDNQPDFSWIMPYETKTFSQYWYPVQQIGPMKNANTRVALNFEVNDGKVDIAVYATEVIEDAKIEITSTNSPVFTETVKLGPGTPFKKQVNMPGAISETELVLYVLTGEGNEIIQYRPEKPWDGKMPEPYQPPAKPAEVENTEELYLVGLHLEQYRHPFVEPEPYWEEAIRRDPEDSRSHVALGRVYFRRGDFEKAENHFRTAIKRITSRNFHPYDGEAYYDLGLTLQYAGRYDEAYDAFYKATWNYAWQSAAFYALAQIDVKRNDYHTAMEHLDRSLQTNLFNNKARNLKTALLRHLGDYENADLLACSTLESDPLDFWARNELVLVAKETGKPRLAQQRQDEMHLLMRGDVQTYLDIAFDYAGAGLWEDTCTLLGAISQGPEYHPMVAYAMGYFAYQLGMQELCSQWFDRGMTANPGYVFPWRLEEMLVLNKVLQVNQNDGMAHYYLGNLLYDKKQTEQAVGHWEACTRINPDFAIPWRNLGLAAYNLEHDIDKALAYIHKAFEANPQDPRILLEYDQLLYRKACPPEERLAMLENHLDVVYQRDDLVSQLMMLNIRTGKSSKALEIASQRQFHPWEGGEGSVAEHYANAHWILGRQALDDGEPSSALDHFMSGQSIPDNLGEVLWESETAHLMYFSGLALNALGKQSEAQLVFEKVVNLKGNLSPVTYFQSLSLQQLGREAEALEKLTVLLKEASAYAENPPGSSFFYFGNPSPIFEDDPKKIQRNYFTFLVGLARLGLKDRIGTRSALAQVLAVDPTRLLAYEEYIRL